MGLGLLLHYAAAVSLVLVATLNHAQCPPVCCTPKAQRAGQISLEPDHYIPDVMHACPIPPHAYDHSLITISLTLTVQTSARGLVLKCPIKDHTYNIDFRQLTQTNSQTGQST